MAVLESSELEAEVGKLPGWEVRDGALEKSFKRGDFNGSMAFLNRIAEAADAAVHHRDAALEQPQRRRDHGRRREDGREERRARGLAVALPLGVGRLGPGGRERH